MTPGLERYKSRRPPTGSVVLAVVLSDAGSAAASDEVAATAAVALDPMLRREPPASMTPGEVGLLTELIDQIARAA
ncbi:MAG: hypothetical protein ACLP7F_04425 [Acidimicrobiales bacterium]